jgi:hypothetical protein
VLTLRHDVLSEAQRVYQQLVAAIEAVVDEALSGPGHFAGMPATWLPWQVIAGSAYEHHAADIQAWPGRDNKST